MTATKLMLDRFIGRLLFVDVPAAPPAERTSEQRAERAFGFSLIFSGVRCILQYAILPFVLPVIGVTSEAAAPISLAINLLAITLILYSLRRFWKIGYRYRWQYLGIAVVALVLLVAFIALDLQVISN